MTIKSFIFLAIIVMPIGNAQARFKQLRKSNPFLSGSAKRKSYYSSESSDSRCAYHRCSNCNEAAGARAFLGIV